MPIKRNSTAKAEVKTVRLNKFLSNAGICNRRAADELIKSGLVKVNGKVVDQLGTKVLVNDNVEFDGKQVYTGEKIYVLLNKPKGFSCNEESNRNEKLAFNLVRKAFSNQSFILDKIDIDDKGLLVFTNDIYAFEESTIKRAALCALYKVELSEPISDKDLKQVELGMQLGANFVKVNKVATTDESKRVLGVEIPMDNASSLKALFQKNGYKVISLDRVMYGDLTKKNLSRGQWRYLNKKEVDQLRKLTNPR